MEDREGGGPPPGESGREAWLAREAMEWVKEGLIQEDQARSILGRYGVVGFDAALSSRQRRLAHMLARLGAVLTGTGVILVVGANWEAIPRALRLLFLMALVAVFYAAGFSLAHSRRTRPATGRALILLGSLIWGASIFLVAQSYHLGAEGGERAAVLIWLLGTLPLVYVMRSPEHAALVVILLFLWYGWTLGDHPVRFAASPTYFLLVAGLGVALYCAGWLHRQRSSLVSVGSVFAVAGVLATLAGIYGLTFDIYRTGAGYFREAVIAPDALLWAVAAATLGAGLGLAMQVWRRAWRQGAADRREAAVLVGLAAAGTACFLAFALGPPGEWVRTPALVISNVLLLGLEVGLVALGLYRMQAWPVNLGLAAFFLHLMTRYFDQIGSLLGGGSAFILAGLVLVAAGAALERQRRRLLDSMHAGRVQ